jgi:hypothetical protein
MDSNLKSPQEKCDQVIKRYVFGKQLNKFQLNF